MRGLKFTGALQSAKSAGVALFVSACIEIYMIQTETMLRNVALFVSAWIEIEKECKRLQGFPGRTLCECVDWNIQLCEHLQKTLGVALFVSAWIEIMSTGYRVPCIAVALFVSAWIEI